MPTGLLGQRFNHRHAAGVTRYQVDRAHRDHGYFECVAIRGVEGTHHFVGGIQVFSQEDIRHALALEQKRLHDAATVPGFDPTRDGALAPGCSDKAVR